MTRNEYLLDVGAEECVELAQRLLKAARFGLDQVQPESHSDGRTDTSTNPEQLSNKQRVEREYSHLVATMELLNFSIDLGEMNAKVAKIERYLQFSRDVGVVQDPWRDACLALLDAAHHEHLVLRLSDEELVAVEMMKQLRAKE